MKALLALGEMGSCIRLLQETVHFIVIEPHDLFLVQLRQPDPGGGIGLDHFVVVEIIVEGLQGGDFPFDTVFPVHHDLLLIFSRAVFQVFHVFLQILNVDLFQVLDPEILDAFPGFPEYGIFRYQELKKNMQIVGIGQTGPGLGPGLNAPEKLPAERRKPCGQFVETVVILFILLLAVGERSFHMRSCLHVVYMVRRSLWRPLMVIYLFIRKTQV